MDFTNNAPHIKNWFKKIQDCDFCHYAAVVFFYMDGSFVGKSICPWCEQAFKNMWTGQLTLCESKTEDLPNAVEGA